MRLLFASFPGQLTFALLVAAAPMGGCDAGSPSGPASGPAANQVFHESWSAGINTSTWTDGYQPSRHSVVSDPTGAGRGPVLRAEHIDNGGAGWLAHWIYGSGTANPTGEIFIRTWIFVPANFNASDYAKMLIIKGNRTDNLYSSFGQAGVPANGTNFFESYVSYGAPSHVDAGIHFYTYHADMPGSYGHIANTRTAPVLDRAPTVGAWHKIEFWLKQNSVGQSDGAQRLWVDDEPILEWTGLRFRADAILQANCVAVTFSSGNNAGQVWYVDDIYVFDRLPSGIPDWN